MTTLCRPLRLTFLLLLLALGTLPVKGVAQDVSEEDLDPAVLDKEKEIYEEQIRSEGKPEDIIPKIVEGKLKKFKKEVALLNQEYVKNPDLTVGELLTETIAKIGENIKIRRFARFERGE